MTARLFVTAPLRWSSYLLHGSTDELLGGRLSTRQQRIQRNLDIIEANRFMRWVGGTGHAVRCEPWDSPRRKPYELGDHLEFAGYRPIHGWGTSQDGLVTRLARYEFVRAARPVRAYNPVREAIR
jgi:hypothetical protein